VLYSFVGTFVFALFIYYSTRRVESHIQRRVGQPTVSATLALVALALPAVLLLLYASAVGLQEFQEFARDTDLTPLVDAAGPLLDVSGAVENPRALLEDAGGMALVRSLASQGTAYLGFVGTGLLHLFVVFAVALYLLRDDQRLARWCDQFDDGGLLTDYAREVDKSLELVFAGNILNAVLAGTVGAITYSILNVASPDAFGVPYPALVGLLAGIASLIPVVGMKLVYVPLLLYLAARAFTSGVGWGFVVVTAAVSFVVVDVIPDLLVRPYVTGGSLHTGSVMFAYILGPLLFGWYGLFLGPMILVFLTHFGRVVVPELLGRDRPSDGGGEDGAAADGVATEGENGDGVTEGTDAAGEGADASDDTSRGTRS
jgi:predicted PurR-regulated permease PerM